MPRFANAIRPAVTAELTAANQSADAAGSFKHLERAHVLGQASTHEHLRAHWAMLRWGIAQRDIPEILGQLIRLIGAATKTAIGLVPEGNTGGSNVSPWRRMPVPDDLKQQIDLARQQSR